MTTPSRPSERTGAYRELGLVVLLLAVAGAVALLVAGRPWQTVTVGRPRPLADDVLEASGRSLQPAVTGLAVVALAAIVALLATGPRARQAVGLVLVAVGVGLGWAGVQGLRSLSRGRALSLVDGAHSGVGVDAGAAVHVSAHHGWPVSVLGCAVLVVLAALVVLVRAPRWATMSRRYEAPKSAPKTDPKSPEYAAASTTDSVGAADPASSAAAADLALWKSLDRGEDPTA